MNCYDNNNVHDYEINFNDSNYYEKYESSKIGFNNFGKSCYINSFLQILFHCPEFLNKLKKYHYHNNDNNNSLIKSLINLSNFPHNKEYLKSIIYFMKKNSHHYDLLIKDDSQDFGIDLINDIISEMRREDKSFEQNENETKDEKKSNLDKKVEYLKYINNYQKNQTPIEEMFILNESETINKSKVFKEIKFNTSTNIELVFPDYYYNREYSLKNLLDYKYNNTDNYNKKNNNNCLKVIQKICKLPKILIITIVRSIIGKNSLINFPLNFPDELYLDPYIDKVLTNPSKNIKYNLFAINEKSGYFKENGHYYCYIKIDNNEWNLFNDKFVSNEYYPSFKSNTNVVGLFYIKSN